jgi:flagellar hook protein FlgE
MSITAAFFTGLSGLDTHATAMQVIGDNIANVHTTGFKAGAAHFEDVLGMSLTGLTANNQTGAGAGVASVDSNFIQGSLEATGVSTDVAVNGQGLFILGVPDTNEVTYSRAGHFFFDEEGYYANTDGYRVQGYLYDSTGLNLIENLADIRIDQNSMIPPKVTSDIDMVVNLDADEPVITDVFDAADPTTYQFSTTVTIYDSLGDSHQVQVFFTQSDLQEWTWNAMIDGSDVQSGIPGVFELYGTGTLEFDTLGQLTSSSAMAMPVDFYAGSASSAIGFFANGLAPPATTINFTFTTQFASPSAIEVLKQDGYPAGNLSGVGIDSEGNLVANYTNGLRKNMARIALADFPSLNGLARVGDTLYRATTTSGDPLYNKPGVGGMGTIASSMLEESNVDLAAEFIRMILIQRGYQANTKVITTADEMLAQLINIR